MLLIDLSVSGSDKHNWSRLGAARISRKDSCHATSSWRSGGGRQLSLNSFIHFLGGDFALWLPITELPFLHTVISTAAKTVDMGCLEVSRLAISLACGGQDFIYGSDSKVVHDRRDVPHSVHCLSFQAFFEAKGLDRRRMSEKRVQIVAPFCQQLDSNELHPRRSHIRQHQLVVRNALSLEKLRVQGSESLITEMKPKMPSKPGCIFQAFGWKSHLQVGGKMFYERMIDLAPEFKVAGFTHILFPPCTRAGDPQGFMPQDFYDLDSAYGSEAQLRAAVTTLHKYGIYVIADVVLHQFVGSGPAHAAAWNKAGTILDSEIEWDEWLVDRRFEDEQEMPEIADADVTRSSCIDHSNPNYQNDVKGWLFWLKKDVGFDGWCFDYAKTHDPKIFQIYGQETSPQIALGDVWHPMRYNGTYLEYNQDDHRQQLCDWVNVSGGTAKVFDYTTKGILQRAVEHTEYWRLSDREGKPSGLLGWWPEMAITFLDNHSTGSEPKLWPYPTWRSELGYVYILTHPGTPCVFAEDFQDVNLQIRIRSLLAIRRQWGICCDSPISILKCDADLYVAKIGSVVDGPDFKGIFVKLGPTFDLRGFLPPPDFQVALSGQDFAVWERATIQETQD